MKNLIAIVEAGEKGCPLATQDLELNTKNRNEPYKQNTFSMVH